MSVFWIGFIIGVFVGANVGILVIALCKSAGDADERAGYKQEIKRAGNNNKTSESIKQTKTAVIGGFLSVVANRTHVLCTFFTGV